MYEFLSTINIGTIIVVSILLIIIIYLVIHKEWLKLRSIAYTFMLILENTVVGSKVGHIRFAMALDYVYSLMPTPLQIFITKELFATYLQKWYLVLKDALDNGYLDKSAK